MFKKIDWLKVKYKLKVLVRPWLWMRNYATSKEFDEWLWEQMQMNTLVVEPHPRLPWTRTIANRKEIWIENSPYADVSTCSDRGIEYAASRATAVRFREVMKEQGVTKPVFQP